MFDQSVQYALNVGHCEVDLSVRSVERYQRLFREKELAQEVFERVTRTLAEKLELEVDKQRLDSTHLFSNMATLSRTQLMTVCIRRFLVQLKRHHNAELYALDPVVRERCMASDRRLFSQSPPEGKNMRSPAPRPSPLRCVRRSCTLKLAVTYGSYIRNSGM